MLPDRNVTRHNLTKSKLALPTLGSQFNVALVYSSHLLLPNLTYVNTYTI
jgi:hypothetical protein